MKKFITTLLGTLMLCLAIPCAAQTSADKAEQQLRQKGYSVQREDANMIATINGDTYYVVVNTSGVVPLLHVSTELRTYDAPSDTMLPAYQFLNDANRQLPMVKFTINTISAGDYGIINGMGSDGIMGFTLAGSFQTFFNDDDQMLFLLDDALTTLSGLRQLVPESF